LLEVAREMTCDSVCGDTLRSLRIDRAGAGE